MRELIGILGIPTAKTADYITAHTLDIVEEHTTILLESIATSIRTAALRKESHTEVYIPVINVTPHIMETLTGTLEELSYHVELSDAGECKYTIDWTM